MASKRRPLSELLLACSVGDLPWVKKEVLAGGNSLRDTNREGFNGLHLAVKNGHIECVKYLLNNSSIDVNTPSSKEGLSPLHCALMCKNEVKIYQCMKVLLDRGANHGMKDVRGRNVLHHVAKSGNMKCLKLLLEFGVDIHEKDNDGRTAYEVACMYNKYETARLLRALHWAHSKDTAKNKKMKEDYLKQKREAEEKALQAQRRAELAEVAYNRWLQEKNFSNSHVTPEQCEKRYLSHSKEKRHSCASCLTDDKKSSSGIEPPRPVSSMKVSYRQEKKNLSSVGKPDKMIPYTNYRPKSVTSRGGSAVSSQRCKTPSARIHSRYHSRATKSAPPQSVQFYAKKLKSRAKERNERGERSRTGISRGEDTYVSHIASSSDEVVVTKIRSIPQKSFMLDEEDEDTYPGPSATAAGALSDEEFSTSMYSDDPDELDFSKLVGQSDELAQFDFVDVEDDASLFHEVGEMNSLDSLALPAVLTKDKTPAEILQLLRHLGSSDNRHGRRLRRSSSFSASNKQLHGHFRRRLSLGSIPEGRVLTDYAEEEEENNIDSQVLRDIEHCILGTETVEQANLSSAETEHESHSPAKPSTPEAEDSNESESFSMLLPPSEDTASSHTLKIVNLAWDTTSNTVQSRVSETRLASSPRRSSSRSPSPTPSNKSLRSNGSTSHIIPTGGVVIAAPPLEIASKKITPSHRDSTLASRKLTPPSSKTTTPMPRSVTPPILLSSRRLTPPSRKLTPPSRKVTPPSRRLTPPSSNLAHLSQHATPVPPPCENQSSSMSPLSRRQSSPPVLISAPVSSYQPTAEDHASPPSLSPITSVTPTFFIGGDDPEEAETIEPQVSHSIKSHSMFLMKNSAMSRSMVMSSGSGESEIVKTQRSASVPVMRYQQSNTDYS